MMNNEDLQKDEILMMEKLLRERPSISIRFRIVVAFLLVFLFSLAITVTSVIFILRLDKKEEFFERARDFTYEIQEARRYEKNFFLYGEKNDLYEGSNHISAAYDLLQKSSNEIRAVTNRKDFEALSNDLNQYKRLLSQLTREVAQSGTESGRRNTEIEEQLRMYGHRILLLSSDIEKKERAKVRSLARTFTLVAIFSVVIIFIVMIWLAMELARQILRPLTRAVGYTQRIAAGDFSPITPKRKFRDEFSDLAIAINRMIREIKQNQEQIIQSRKMAAIGTLTSGIAHELNNPLNNISITVEALLDGLDDYTDEQKRKMLKDIFIELDRASGTVRNLLDFTRIKKPRLEPIDVAELVDSGINLVRNELALNNVVVDKRVPENLPKAKGNFRNLQQVLLNLFLNSIQAMPDGGTLSVQAEQDGEFIELNVKDTGHGIKKENIDKIFDPFFTTKEEGEGTGLGLSVSYGIIQKIGGNISVESEPGKGTVFHVYIPLWEKQTRA